MSAYTALPDLKDSVKSSIKKLSSFPELLNKWKIGKRNFPLGGAKMKTQSTWNKYVHAPFKKVVAFDLLCMAMGMPIGAGLATAFLTGDIYKILPWVMEHARYIM